jgi:hypothetical protein
MMKLLRFFIAALLFSVTLVVLVPLLLLTLLPALYFLLFRIIHRALQPQILQWEDIIEFSPGIGWKPKPNLDAVYLDKIGDKCSIITDGEGWAGRLSIAEADIVVVGDSFAFGYGAEHKKSYAFVDPEIKIKPLAAPGYNMVQELMLIKKYADKLQGKNLGWFICLENDLYDNMLPYHSTLYSTPFVKQNIRENTWQVMREHISETSGNTVLNQGRPYLDFYEKLGSLNILSNRAFSAARYLINKAAQICSQNNISLHVIGIPYKDHLKEDKLFKSSNGQGDFNEDYIDSQFTEICNDFEIPYYSLRNWLTINDYKKYDTHWNEKGNENIAKFLKSLSGYPKKNLTPNC